MTKRIDSSSTVPVDELSDAYLHQFQVGRQADFAEFVTEFVAPLPKKPRFLQRVWLALRVNRHSLVQAWRTFAREQQQH
jgi:hypothetical protein